MPDFVGGKIKMMINKGIIENFARDVHLKVEYEEKDNLFVCRFKLPGKRSSNIVGDFKVIINKQPNKIGKGLKNFIRQRISYSKRFFHNSRPISAQGLMTIYQACIRTISIVFDPLTPAYNEQVIDLLDGIEEILISTLE